MDITCISDLHGHYPELEGGDLLIVAGDLTKNDTKDELLEFHNWLNRQLYKNKILIAGNHDNLLEKMGRYPFYNRTFWTDGCLISPCKVQYLCDAGTEFEGLKIWGSPWSKTFEGMNPKRKAFTVETEEELRDKFALAPVDTDILITHCPPHMILDKIIEEGKHIGSTALNCIIQRIEPQLHVFGHIHEGHGKTEISLRPKARSSLFVNASHVNEHYEPVNKPIRVIL